MCWLYDSISFHFIFWFFFLSLINNLLRVGLDCMLRVCVCVFLFFLFFFCTRLWVCDYCSCIVQWTVAANFDFSIFFQSISVDRALFMDPQISLFSNFFIKNGSHDIIYTFKNYFITVFFSFSVSVFSFQFSAVSKWTLSVCLTNLVFVNLFYYSTYFHYYL